MRCCAYLICNTAFHWVGDHGAHKRYFFYVAEISRHNVELSVLQTKKCGATDLMERRISVTQEWVQT